MIKVIETNIFIDENYSFQSRVIEVESWESLIEEVENKEVVIRESYLGNYMGVTVPKSARIENLKYNDTQLSFDIYTYKNAHVKKLIYKVIE